MAGSESDSEDSYDFNLSLSPSYTIASVFGADMISATIQQRSVGNQWRSNLFRRSVYVTIGSKTLNRDLEVWVEAKLLDPTTGVVMDANEFNDNGDGISSSAPTLIATASLAAGDTYTSPFIGDDALTRPAWPTVAPAMNHDSKAGYQFTDFTPDVLFKWNVAGGLSFY
jgi:hypothetical protein